MSQSRAQRRLVALGGGLVVALVLLELGLRLAGALFLWQQEKRNAEAVAERGEVVVLCVGESTTALGGEDSYPSQLEEVLNEASDGPRYSVVNKGIPGTDTSVIIEQLAENLDRYQPQVVVAMMGANDFGGAIPHHDRKASERTGFPYNLKVFKLGALLAHQVRKSLQDEPPVPAGEHGVEAADPLSGFWAGAGRYAERRGRLDEAETAFTRALLLDQSAARYLDLARYYERLERHTEAEQYFAKACERAPERPDGWYGRGRILRKEEDFAAAAQMFAAAIERDPDNSFAYTSLGICYDELGRLAEAEAAFVAGLEKDPLSFRVFIRLVDFYEKHDRHAEAEALFDRGLGEKPDPIFLGRVARYYARTNRPAEAARFFDQARKRHREGWHHMTEEAYRRMHELLTRRAVDMVVVQYPTRSVAPLELMLADLEGITFVDNEALFNDVLAKEPYEALFWDNCYGDFGHCTRRGNRMLAENIARAILGRAELAPGPREVPAEEMVEIPAITYVQGAVRGDVDARPCEGPARTVTVSSFLLDRHEVTVAAFLEAVEAGVLDPPKCRVHNLWEAMLCNHYFPRTRAAHPVNGVTWHQAEGYCRYRGKRLPTEAEFEAVLRDGREGLLYPWGNDFPPPPDYGNYVDEEFPEFLAEETPPQGFRDGFLWTAPVASKAANAYGVHDLSGNIWEWCADWFSEVGYPAGPALDPTGPEEGKARILRGGNFHCVRVELRNSERHYKRPEDGSVYSGFRCARDRQPAEE